MKIDFTNATEIISEINELKNLGKIRAKGCFGVTGVLDYVYDRLNEFNLGEDVKKFLNFTGEHWGEWLASLLMSEEEDTPEDRCYAAYQILKHIVCYTPCGTDVRDEMSAVGDVLAEVKAQFRNKFVEIVVCKICGNPLSRQELEGTNSHKCPAYLSNTDTVGVKVTKENNFTIAEFALRAWLKGCLLCGGVLPKSNGLQLIKYCHDHNPSNGKKYRNGLNQIEIVIKYLTQIDELDEQRLNMAKDNETKLGLMWAAINKRVGGKLDWDDMESEYKKLLVLAMPKSKKMAENKKKIAELLSLGKTQSAIAKELRISRQRINQIIKTL